MEVLAQPDLKERMLGMGFEPVGFRPERFAAYVRAKVAKWAKVVREAGIRIG